MADQIDVSSTRPAPADGIDPSVRVPNAVRAAAARSEEIMRQVSGEPPVGDPPAPETPPAGDPPAAPPAPKPEPKARQKSETPPEQPPAGEIDWESRFNAMQGRFNKSNDDNRRLAETVSNLQNVIARMESTPPAPPPTPAELRPESLLSKEEIDAYGPEFLEVVGKKAREIAAAETRELREQIAKLNTGVEATTRVTAQTARENMFQSLDDQVPNWRELNVDQNFLSWLRLPDPYSGAIRQDLLTAAFEQNSTPRVSAFFQGFLTEEAAVAPVRTTPPVTPPASTPQKVPLAQFAAPGRAKSAAANGAPAEKPIIKRSEVTQFYAEVAAGKYRGRDDEKNRAEAQIFEAEREGRIR